MIKIIKPGTRRITVCLYCGCEFSFEDEDTFEKCIDGYKTYQKYVVCPQCHKEQRFLGRREIK